MTPPKNGTDTNLSGLENLPGYKRTQPSYFQDPDIDLLIEICVLLGAEVWTNRNRQFVIEALLERDGAVTEEAIEKFIPDDDFKEKVREQRKEFVKRIYKPLYADKFIEEQGNFFDWLTK